MGTVDKADLNQDSRKTLRRGRQVLIIRFNGNKNPALVMWSVLSKLDCAIRSTKLPGPGKSCNWEPLQVLHGPVLAIIYETQGVNTQMFAQMDTLELIVLADLSSSVDKNDAVATLLGSLGVSITVVSAQADIDATGDALFTYIALLNQPVVAPQFKPLQEPEAVPDSQVEYPWKNSNTEMSNGPSLNGPVTPSTRMPQASMRKESLWETANKRQSLGQRTLGLVGLDHIGLALARRARAFGMQILVYDPHVPEGLALGFGLQQVGYLSHLLAESDVISIHWKPRSLISQGMNVRTERDQVVPVNLDSAFMDAMKKDSVLLCLDHEGTIDVKELGARLKAGRLPYAVLLDRVVARLPLHSQVALNELDNCFRLRSANLMTRHSLFNLRRQAAMAVLSFLLSKRSDWSESTEHLLSRRQHGQASSMDASQVKLRRGTAENRSDTENQADSLRHQTRGKPGQGNSGAHEETSRKFSDLLYHKVQTAWLCIRSVGAFSPTGVQSSMTTRYSPFMKALSTYYAQYLPLNICSTVSSSSSSVDVCDIISHC
ncbi:unnamed protein product [Schistocephalus solidus]|uniref:2-Hacid_dh_C domain-containing protein n=1 Tax=Schistocephalus solidus TaxID=70667 RepID=A0A183SIW7_SCHSO|nr:unnamed protein product [Schistocephalus solidus]